MAAFKSPITVTVTSKKSGRGHPKASMWLPGHGDAGSYCFTMAMHSPVLRVTSGPHHSFHPSHNSRATAFRPVKLGNARHIWGVSHFTINKTEVGVLKAKENVC